MFIIIISESRTQEVYKLSTLQSPVLRLDLISRSVQQRRELDLGDAPQLVKVEILPIADIAGIMIHRVGDRACTFEELSGREAVLVERLVV